MADKKQEVKLDFIWEIPDPNRDRRNSGQFKGIDKKKIREILESVRRTAELPPHKE